jgi:hypothetical protein
MPEKPKKNKRLTTIVDGVSYDNCVGCWKKTKYLTTTPISERRFYIEGAGQLCEACSHRICENLSSICP